MMKKSFNYTTLNATLRAAYLSTLGLALGATAYANETTDLGVLTVSFETANRYAPASSTGAVGLELTNRETPQLVSTINKARIKDQNLQTMQQVMDNTAGMSVMAIDGGRVSFASRGFGIGQFSVDGADIDFNQQMSIGEYHLNTAIYDKVEVTHGATGLVSGSGEPSARINLVRKKANSSRQATEIVANANRFESYGISIDHNQALNKAGTLRGRVVALHQDGKTFTDREKKGQTAVYATIQADIGNQTTADIGAMISENRQRNVMWGGLPSYFSDGTKTDWAVDKNGSTDWTKWDRETKEYFVNLEHRFDDNWKLNAKVAYSESEGSPKLFYHGYGVVDKATGLGAGVSNPAWYYSLYRADNYNKQAHAQIDLSGSFEAFGQRHQALLGTHYNKHNLTAYQYSTTSTPNPTSFLAWDGSYPEPIWGKRGETPAADVDSTEKSVYGALQLKPSDRSSLVLGSRLSDYDKTGEQWGTKVSSKAKRAFTPYAGIIYDFNDNSSVYASYTSIFQPQARRNTMGDYLKPEEGNTYEVGIKGSADDKKLQSQFVIFRTEKDNVAKALPNQYVASTAGTNREQAYEAVSGTVSQGVEIEVNGKLSPHWQMMAGFTQFKTKDQTGKELMPETAKRMIKLFTIYDMSRFVDGLSVGGGVNWYDKRYALLTNPATNQQEKYEQKAVALVNVMARYAVNPNLDFQLNITNLLDQKYKNGSGFNQYIYGEPLNVTGSVSYRF